MNWWPLSNSECPECGEQQKMDSDNDSAVCDNDECRAILLVSVEGERIEVESA